MSPFPAGGHAPASASNAGAPISYTLVQAGTIPETAIAFQRRRWYVTSVGQESRLGATWFLYQEKKPWNPRFHGFDAIVALT